MGLEEYPRAGLRVGLVRDSVGMVRDAVKMGVCLCIVGWRLDCCCCQIVYSNNARVSTPRYYDKMALLRFKAGERGRVIHCVCVEQRSVRELETRACRRLAPCNSKVHSEAFM